jgi:hypothetical protein
MIIHCLADHCARGVRRLGISIPALGIDNDIPPKSNVQVDVTFPASGMLAISCKFHGSLGMNGQLLTSDAGPSGAH